jgi:hypothetical protein
MAADTSSVPGAARRPFWSRVAPALTLMLMAPLLTEVLPGATRFSSIFVFPIEVCVWGGGALLIRAAVRRWRLGWLNLLLLALGLAIAEECLIQQTSLAPMVIRLKGEVYARALGVNYVYLLWALVYESVFVVFLPIKLTELIFPSRREGAWVGLAGVIVTALFFAIGGFLAWFSWTQIARPKVFHLPAFDPPLVAVLTAAGLIVVLALAALGPARRAVAASARPLPPPSPWLIGGGAAVWAVLWYALVVLAFGLRPDFPPVVAVTAGLAITAAILLFQPRWSAHPGWRRAHDYALAAGAVLGSMAVGYVGFIGATSADLGFKVVTNLIAVALLAWLGAARLRRGRP